LLSQLAASHHSFIVSFGSGQSNLYNQDLSSLSSGCPEHSIIDTVPIFCAYLYPSVILMYKTFVLCVETTPVSTGHISLDIPPPRHFPLPDNSCSLFTGLGGYFSRFHPPVNNIKRSTVNVYKIDSGRSVRVRSIRDSASFQMFALTAGWNVQRLDGDRGKLSGPGKCPEGNMSDLLKHCHCHNVQSQLQRSDVTSEWENDPGK